MLKKYFIPLVIVATSSMILAQQPGAGPYTAQQAAAGQASYQANCAGCHQQNLGGSGDAPPLRGTQFVTNWGPRTTRELLSFMQLTMPPARPGVMSADEYAGIVAFILQSNGVGAGNQALTAATEVRINSLAMGQAPAAGAQAAAPKPPAQARGVTVNGEVKNYVPVTDAMLLNPNPNDWLMIRHDYHASNYSSLNQITKDNVKDLRLQWAWAMNEGGGTGNGPAPIVHNGVLYVNNMGNILQALGKQLRHERDSRFHARYHDL
jgi:mono/diheme cytochrome c family protein